MGKSLKPMSRQTKKDQAMSRMTRKDGWSNIYTREGVSGSDKNTGFSFAPASLYTENLAREIYRADGIGKKVVDRPCEDMTRRWFDIPGDVEGSVSSALSKLRAKQHTKEALTWSKVFGGSVMLMLINDGGELEDPVNEQNIKSIEGLKVYQRYRVQWLTSELYDDPSDPKFGTPEFYRIYPIQGNEFLVHETRLLRFDGQLCDDYTLSRNNWWPESMYLAIQKQLVELNSTYSGTKNVIDDFIQTILKVNNLQDLIASGQDDLIKARLNIIDLGRNSINTIMIDGEEEYTKEASSVSGLDKLIQEFQLALSAVTDIPLTILMGRSPGGMNSTGDADIRLYYDNIASAQEDYMLPQMQRLVYLLMLSKEGPTKGVEIENWSIVFRPLWQPTEKEKADTRKVQAETDEKYINTGVLSPEEVAISRFGGEEYSTETDIDPDTREPLPPDNTQETNQNTDSMHKAEDPDDDDSTDSSKSKYMKRKKKKDKVKKDTAKPAGKTSNDDNHSHDYVIYDEIRGLGYTSPSGKDNHSHQIVNFDVQFHTNPDGLLHAHKLPKA